MSVLTCLCQKKSLDLNNIVCLQAQVNYTKIFLVEGKPILMSKTLKLFEKLLCEVEFNRFYRPNKTYIINLDHIVNVEKVNSVVHVELANNFKFPISRRKKKVFINLMVAPHK